MLDAIQNFKHSQDVIFNSIEFFMDEKKDKSRYKEHELSISHSEESDYYSDDLKREEWAEKTFNDTNQLVKSVWENFYGTFANFLELVKDKPEMKSLAFKLDFNEYYKDKDIRFFKRTVNYKEFMNNRRSGGGGGSYLGGMDIEN